MDSNWEESKLDAIPELPPLFVNFVISNELRQRESLLDPVKMMIGPTHTVNDEASSSISNFGNGYFKFLSKN